MTGSTLIIAIVSIITIAVGGYFVLHYLRGSIKINLNKRAFDLDEPITGTFDLTVRKDIEGNRLYAAVYANKVVKTKRNNDETHTDIREIYRNETTIEPARVFKGGESRRYEFKLKLPQRQGTEALNSELLQLINMGISLFSDQRTYVDWYVEVRLDAKGIDIAKREKIIVNL